MKADPLKTFLTWIMSTPVCEENFLKDHYTNPVKYTLGGPEVNFAIIVRRQHLYRPHPHPTPFWSTI